jgi:nucleoside 2-deoxyribosyltransferase
MLIDQVIKQAFIEVKKSDVILAFIESEEKSEGMLLEIGYAKALGKKLVLVIKR